MYTSSRRAICLSPSRARNHRPNLTSHLTSHSLSLAPYSPPPTIAIPFALARSHMLIANMALCLTREERLQAEARALCTAGSARFASLCMCGNTSERSSSLLGREPMFIAARLLLFSVREREGERPRQKRRTSRGCSVIERARVIALRLTLYSASHTHTHTLSLSLYLSISFLLRTSHSFSFARA
jgi:hypothetical protein